MSASPVPTGVLLANVGTPDGPDPSSVRRFLSEFLSDPAVVALPRWLWIPILRGLVLPLRSRSSARLYARIWTEEGSPLVAHGRRLREALALQLGPAYRVALGLRYGNPSLVRGIDELLAARCRRIVLAPLFPQASFATTGSVRSEVERALRDRREAPELRPLPSFCGDPGYLRAVAGRVRAARGGRDVDHHLFSFHGLPESSVALGDPYRSECAVTARGLARELGLDDGAWTLCFQSRFGRRWLGPQTLDVARSLAADGRTILVAMPGFAADCLETLEEIGIRLRESFLRAGGGDVIVVPALNDDDAWVAALARLVGAQSWDARVR